MKNLNKKIFIFLFILLVVVLFCFLAYKNFYSDNYSTEEKNKETSNENYEKIFSPEEKKQDKENYDSANKSNDVKKCSSIIKPRTKNLCYKELALSTLDTKICDQIEDEEIKSSCLNELMLKKTVDNVDFLSCQDIDDMMLAKKCIKDIVKSNDGNLECELLDNNELFNHCQAEKYLYLAKKNNDYKLCSHIGMAIIRANCLSELNDIPLDSDFDNDGLLFLQEIINGTDPDKKDSDSDGFIDDVEVNSGYNPLGEGKINELFNPVIINCKDIDDLNILEKCYEEMKDEYIDLSKCDQIKDPELFDYCSRM